MLVRAQFFTAYTVSVNFRFTSIVKPFYADYSLQPAQPYAGGFRFYRDFQGWCRKMQGIAVL